MTRLATFIAVIIIAIICYFAFFASESDETLQYSLAKVQMADIESVVSTTGSLTALNTVLVGSQLSGQIADLQADFNSTVTENQIIARIDPRTFETRVQQSQAELAIANANIVQQEAELIKAKTAEHQAYLNLERLQKLEKEGHVSESELDSVKANLESAQAQIEIAKAQQVNAQAARSLRQATLRQAELDLERSYIRSPINGTVIERNIELGQTVAASLQAPTLFTIAQDLHWMKVEASVDEADIGRLGEGMQCRFSVDAYPERIYKGQIKQIRKAPNIFQNVVTYKVIIETNNEDLSLFPGMTANVEIVLGSKDQVISVPNAALRFKPKSAEDESPPGNVLNSLMSGGHYNGPRQASQAGATGQESETPSGPNSMAAGFMSPREDPIQLLARIRNITTLTEEQEQQVTALLAGQRDKVKELIGSGMSREEIRAEFQSNHQANLQKMAQILGSDVVEKLRSEAAGRSSKVSRQATVWVLGADHQPVAKVIRIGISDDTMTEVIEGLVKGEDVIVRATRKQG